MNDLDLVRAYVEGWLPPKERARFDERLAADAGLRALHALYAPVHEATADPVPPPAAPAALRPVPARRRRWPWIAAAAAACIAAAVVLRPRPPEPLLLHAIALDAALPPDPLPIPPALADYAPERDGGLAFLGDLDAAREVASFTGRPLLLYVHFPGCPLCTQAERTQFRAPEVREAAAPFVLAEMNYMRARTEVLGGAPYQGPLLVDLAAKKAVSALAAPADLARVLGDWRGAAGDWERPRAWARRLREAEAAPPAQAVALWQAVAAEDPDGPFGAHARARIERLAFEAAQVVRDARGGPGALARLRQARPRFEGTPWGEDLRRIADRIERDGAFPPLRETPQ